jgi:hypothetical protein
MKKKILVSGILVLSAAVASGFMFYHVNAKKQSLLNYLELGVEANDTTIMGDFAVFNQLKNGDRAIPIYIRGPIVEDADTLWNKENTSYEKASSFLLPVIVGMKTKECVDNVHKFRNIAIAYLSKISGQYVFDPDLIPVGILYQRHSERLSQECLSSSGLKSE